MEGVVGGVSGDPTTTVSVILKAQCSRNMGERAQAVL